MAETRKFFTFFWSKRLKILNSNFSHLQREDFEASRKPKPFVSNDADVLKQKPFVPHISKKPTTELVPFNLHSDDRLKHRRQFDEQTRAELEKKKQEEEKQRQEEDERIRREIRKASTFKAQPNPFK